MYKNIQDDQLERELKEYFISIISVPWEKIVFYAKCSEYSNSIRFAFKEKETGVIVTNDFFFKRYDKYSKDKLDIYSDLLDFSEKLYKTYSEKSGEEKQYLSISYIIKEGDNSSIDLPTNMPELGMFEERNWLVKQYFNEEYKRIKGKYPSLE